MSRASHQRSCLGVGQLVLGKVAADAVAQALGLADVDDAASGVLVQIYAGNERKLACLVRSSMGGEAIIELCHARFWRCSWRRWPCSTRRIGVN